MKSVVILLFVFGCVAVVFAAHWARRAVNATKEAPANFTETVRRLYAQETTPDAYHPSSSQRDYVRTNLDEFVSLHREEMERLVDDALARFRAKKVAAGEPMSDGELAEAERSARILMASRFAKSLVRASWRRVAKIRTRRPQLYKPEASCDSRERWWMAVGEISEKRQPVRVFS